MNILALIWKPLLAILAVVGGVFFIRRDAKKDARAAMKEAALREYVETRKKADNAEIVGDDPAAARRWLSERDPNRN